MEKKSWRKSDAAVLVSPVVNMHHHQQQQQHTHVLFAKWQAPPMSRHIVQSHCFTSMPVHLSQLLLLSEERNRASDCDRLY